MTANFTQTDMNPYLEICPQLVGDFIYIYFSVLISGKKFYYYMIMCENRRLWRNFVANCCAL